MLISVEAIFRRRQHFIFSTIHTEMNPEASVVCACAPPTVKVQPAQWDDYEGHFPGAGNACAERTTLTDRVETLTGCLSRGTPLCSPLVMEAATLHTNHLAANSSHC
jgi:hypothetical protein